MRRMGLIGLLLTAACAYGDVGLAGLHAESWPVFFGGQLICSALTFCGLILLGACAFGLYRAVCRMRAGWTRAMNELPLLLICCLLLAAAAQAQQDFSMTPGTNSAVVLAKRNLTVGRVPAWTKSTAYAAGDYFMTAAQQFYLVRTAGTSGTTAPAAESTAVTNGTLVAEFVPPGPRNGFVVQNTGTNIVDLTIAGGPAGIRLWPRGSWSETGLSCPQEEIRAVTDGGSGALQGCWW